MHAPIPVRGPSRSGSTGSLVCLRKKLVGCSALRPPARPMVAAARFGALPLNVLASAWSANCGAGGKVWDRPEHTGWRRTSGWNIARQVRALAHVQGPQTPLAPRLALQRGGAPHL